MKKTIPDYIPLFLYLGSMLSQKYNFLAIQQRFDCWTADFFRKINIRENNFLKINKKTVRSSLFKSYIKLL